MAQQQVRISCVFDLLSDIECISAFNAIVGSFVILSSLSYVAAILPYLVNGRSGIPKGPFHMGKAGFFVNAGAVAYMLVWDVIYLFPYTTREFFGFENGTKS